MRKNCVQFIFLANLIVILAIWWQGSRVLLMSTNWGDILIALGRVMGLLGEYLILTQLILIGRVRAVEQLYGFDKLNAWHRTLGYMLGIVLIFHPILLTIGYAHRNHTTLTNQFLDFIANWENVMEATIGLILLCGIVIISINIIRKKLRYETWYFTHLLIYLAIGLTFSHQIETGDLAHKGALYYWYALNFLIFGLLLLYRFIRPLYLYYKHQFFIEKIVKETPSVYSVYITGRKMEQFIFEPGQYANLTFIAQKMWHAHPFSFSAAPNGINLRFSIKSLGDFTEQIKNLQPRTKVIIDGPLGIFTERQSTKNKYLLIAGGIGITPIRALIESLSKKGADTILLCGNKSVEDITFEDELKKFSTQCHIILSRDTHSNYGHGYIDSEKIQRLAPDFKEREIYICGPGLMMETVVRTLITMGATSTQIHYEKFEY